MNFRQAPARVPGSKVSYTLFAPEKNLDFEKFNQSKKQILVLLKERAPRAMKVIMSEPERPQDQIWTAFSSFREA